MIPILDLRYCIKIGDNTIETMDKNCKRLEVFYQNMKLLKTLKKPFVDADTIVNASASSKGFRKVSIRCIFRQKTPKRF